MVDIYDSPQNFGCEKVAEISDSTLSWEYDILCVWREIATGKVYWGHDTGCSCPSPFENYHSVADLNNVHEGSMDAFVTEVDSLDFGTLTEKANLIRRVRALVDDFDLWVRETRQKAGIVDEA